MDYERPRAATRLRGPLGIALALLIAAIPIGWIVLAATASDPKVDLLSAVTGGLVVAAAVLYAEHRSTATVEERRRAQMELERLKVLKTLTTYVGSELIKPPRPTES